MKPSRVGPRGPSRLAGPALALLLAAALSAALSSCGLETVRIFSPPSLTYEGNQFTLTHNSGNDGDATFLGYDIYYHIYDSANASKATEDRKAVESLAAQENSTPGTCIDKLVSLNYFRLKDASGSEDNRPLFTIDADNVFKILMSSNSDWFFYRSLSDSEVSANRHVVTRWISDAGDPVSFTSSYRSSDSDYTGSDLSNGTVNVVFFAVAYGFDFSGSFLTIQSLPASTSTDISISITP
jgi:hypothetical protein